MMKLMLRASFLGGVVLTIVNLLAFNMRDSEMMLFHDALDILYQSRS